MSERAEQNESWLVIPFYSDPSLSTYSTTLDRFGAFAQKAKEITGLRLAVIDDGSHLTLENLNSTPDILVNLPSNIGKAAAMRVGLKNLLDNQGNLGFIVQYDGDGDQSYIDIPVVHQRLLDISDADPDIPTLVIGDRYSEDLQTPPNPESVVYRQTILMFFGAIAKELGFTNVRDWVSGARGYTKNYAEEFLARSKSDRYGLESDQLVIASLVGARVSTAFLTESRPRDPHTLTSKWLQNFEVYSDHDKALRQAGKGALVDLIGNLVSNLKAEPNIFTLDLKPIGEDTEIKFTRIDDRYTAEIPAEFRARLFVVGSQFPFTIKKP